MSFQFRFEKILNMKEKEKESALNEMNMVRKKKEIAEGELLELVERKESYLQDFEQKASLRVTEMLEREQYLYFLDKQIERVKRKVADLTRDFNLKNQLLLSKNQEEKVWSTWREKSFDEYSEKIKRDEQNMLDEMAVIRYFHNRV
ncbi:flagellar export protein FliJ [Neobacillus rhizophilus]|uniref:Flagellar FliJ protein n=1 Tax=Neobacillus rhizophilus TaxID=2833579 RepID=A0A942U650_9BACI|nr:flagellar export protein FliJ [Neobacillus rhizophilus]MBS4213048.1 flagellar export protein FliJ [Neobacillus rhizophilus]MBU8918264.1 flagellar export protein FliJ [Bacillus sp. FJAT-29953]